MNLLENEMYKHCDLNDNYISLHDCHAERINFENGVLSFIFPDGFWVAEEHCRNESNDTVRTDFAQVDFRIADEEIDGIEIYIFKRKIGGKIIREEWELQDFINAVNKGDFRVEFITHYKSYKSNLFKCWVWFDKAPYHFECEIVLYAEETVYNWNNLRYDCTW